MDLSELSLPKEASEGQWFDFVHPITTKVVEGFRIKIASSDTDEYRLHLASALRRFSNAALKGKRNNDFLPTPNQEDSAEISAMSRYIVMDFQGIEVEGNPLDGSKIEDRETLLSQVLVREFVKDKAMAIAKSILEDRELKNLRNGQSGITEETTLNEQR